MYLAEAKRIAAPLYTFSFFGLDIPSHFSTVSLHSCFVLGLQVMDKAAVDKIEKVLYSLCCVRGKFMQSVVATGKN